MVSSTRIAPSPFESATHSGVLPPSGRPRVPPRIPRFRALPLDRTFHRAFQASPSRDLIFGSGSFDLPIFGITASSMPTRRFVLPKVHDLSSPDVPAPIITSRRSSLTTRNSSRQGVQRARSHEVMWAEGLASTQWPPRPASLSRRPSRVGGVEAQEGARSASISRRPSDSGHHDGVLF